MTTTCDKNGKLTSRIRTLDAVIKRGDNTLVSSKCADINAVLLELIGVSKAVINNVIFCHQEDSNWPLSEGKVLKEKFDEIFGSIGYVKALKRIKDLRTEYVKLQTVSEGEFKLYAEYKSQVEKYEAELAKNEATLASHKASISTLQQELEPIQRELESIVLKEKALIEIERAISKLKSQLNEQQKTYNYLKSNIKEEFHGSKQQLTQALADFENELNLKVKKQRLAESNLASLRQQLKSINDKQTILTLEKVKLNQCRERYINSLKLQKEMMTNLMADEEISKVNSDLFMDLDDQDEEFEELQSQLDQVNKEYKIKISQIDQQLDDHKSTRSKLEQSIKINQDLTESANQEIAELKVKLRTIDTSGEAVKSLKKQIEELAQELKQLESETDVNEINFKINQLQASQDQIKIDIEELNKEKDRLQSRNENQAVLNVLTSNRFKEEENLNLIYSQNVLIMSELNINEMDFSKSFSNELQNRINRSNHSINAMESKLESLTNDRRAKEHAFNLEKMKLDDLRKKVKAKENQIRLLCDDDDYETALEELEKDVEALREKKFNFLGSQALLMEYCSIIKEEDKCPVCFNNILEESNKKSIIETLKLKIEKVPEQTKSIVSQLERQEKLYNQLLGLASDNQFVKNFKQDMPKLNQTVARCESQLKTICSEVEKADKELRKEKFELKRLKSVESDAAKYDHSIEMLVKLDKQIRDINRDMYTHGDAADNDEDKLLKDKRCLNDVKDDLDLKNSQLRKTEKELRKAQKTKEEYNLKSSQLNQKIISTEKTKLDLEKNQQKCISFQDKIEDLKTKLSQFSQSMVQSNQELEKVNSNLSQLSQSKKQLVCEQKARGDEVSVVIEKVVKYQNQLDTIIKEINEYTNQNVDSQLKEFENKLNTLKEEIDAINGQIDDQVEIIKKYSKEISEAEVKERDLKDNLVLMECSLVLSECSAQLKQEVEKRGFQDSLGLLKKKQELEKQCSEKAQRVQHLKGVQEPIVLKNKELKSELKKEKYKSAKQNYRKKKIDLIVNKVICDDLNKYYKALDHSVMIYHNKKMEEINRLVFKLWKQAYRGTDIDHIKIVSDENDERSAEDKRKTFNYRVVMVKNGREMDMRGRCSAGQKVIASLVIRLALAEIFCINCGILALDEPTTNLDKENIQAFSDAVIDIVESHRFHRFQLLIITHDEQFLRCLNESSNEFYYKIDKDDDGHSKITRYSIRERDE